MDNVIKSMFWVNNLDPNFLKITKSSIPIYFHIKSLIFQHTIPNSCSISAMAMNNILFRFIKFLNVLCYIYVLHSWIAHLVLILLLLLMLVLSTIRLAYVCLGLFCSQCLHLQWNLVYMFGNLLISFTKVMSSSLSHLCNQFLAFFEYSP